MRINTNIASINAQRNLSVTDRAVQDSMQKLSSGFRINRAGDDAAGLGIANKLRADIRSMSQAGRNADQAGSLLQIAEGATGTVQKMLERMKELASQAASDTVDADGRGRLQTEFDALVDEIDRTVDTTTFQGVSLLKGNGSGGAKSFSFLVSSSGAYAGQDNVQVSLDSLSSSILGSTTGKLNTLKTTTTSGTSAVAASVFAAASDNLTAGGSNTGTGNVTADGTYSGAADATISVQYDGTNFQYSTDGSTWTNFTGTSATVAGVTLDVSGVSSPAANDSWSIAATAAVAAVPAGSTGGILTIAGAQSTMASVDEAIKQVSKQLGNIGAAQNRIDYAIDNIKTSVQNFTAAESVIRDLDMAEEMSKFSKNQILSQAGTAMLAQANQSAQGVLQLLRG